MKKLMMAVLGLACAAGLAVAGNIDSPGDPSAGSGMYTLQNLYDYLVSGTALTIAGSFQEPTAGPASTMKNTKEIGDGIKTLFDQCDVTVADVQSGKKFFSTQSGSWGVKTGTLTATASYEWGDADHKTVIDRTKNWWDYDHQTDGALMWASDSTGPGCANGSVMNWSSAVAWADNLVFAGYDDWKLPNAWMMYSIMDYSRSAPKINTTYFPNVPSESQYWTNTPGSTGVYYTGYFTTACLLQKVSSGTYQVRAVRRAQ